MNVKKDKKHLTSQTESISKAEPVSEYEPPTMITYSEEELLEEIGPIQASTGFSNSVIGC